jgi:hypothetical protein
VNDVSSDVLSGVTHRVVDLYTQGGFLFTALDVSNAVKQTLPTVRHREVSPLVRALFDQGFMGDAYQRTTINVIAEGRKPAEAFLYHLSGADVVTGYGEERRRQLAIPPVSASLDDDGDDLDDEEGEVTLEVGADGRLRVPRKLLTLAGITGEKVVVEQVGDELLVSAFLSFMSPPVRAHVLELAHPSLLHVPRSLVELFDASEPIVAGVRGNQVRISGTLG